MSTSIHSQPQQIPEQDENHQYRLQRLDVDTLSNRRHVLYDFVHKTYLGLVARERAEYGDDVTIAVACRLDVSVVVNAAGRADYYVNEVERIHSMHLLPGIEALELTGDRFIDSLADSLLAWVTRKKNGTLGHWLNQLPQTPVQHLGF